MNGWMDGLKALPGLASTMPFGLSASTLVHLLAPRLVLTLLGSFPCRSAPSTPLHLLRTRTHPLGPSSDK